MTPFQMLEEKENKIDEIIHNEPHVTASAAAPSEETTNEKQNTLVETTFAVDLVDPAKEGTEIAQGEISSTEKTEDSEDGPAGAIDEIAESNAEDAEDAEDHGHHQRHKIALLDYHAMNIENLTGELQRLVKNEKVQAIKKHVDGIKHEFELKFQEFIEHKKQDFIAGGGQETDFKYNSLTKRQFDEVYAEYREKRNQYAKNIEKAHKENLQKRLDLIDELKSLVSIEEDINTTYKTFKDIQSRWRGIGPIPRANYNDVWKTYEHHVEIFYDFLSLNRELRDLDFKHNLEEKQKIAEQAEALATENDLAKAFRELQMLHKIWKEDIGPVDRVHRDEIWDRFSNATKVLHQRRLMHQKEIDQVYEQNLAKKQEIIAQINAVALEVVGSPNKLNQFATRIETLRNDFFKAGKVPLKVNERTWAEFKSAVRAFNHNKNDFYKHIKKEQQENLDKKRLLLARANTIKDSEDWEKATEEMKAVQAEWKTIGHVPRKYSDKIWKDFKNACNHYFDRLHALKNGAKKEELVNLEQKEACLAKLKNFELSGERAKDKQAIKEFLEEWKSIGQVPFNKKSINQKFNTIIDAIFKKLDVNKQESELLLFGNKITNFAKEDNATALANERAFIRKKIDETKEELMQLENNLQFFSNASEDNPLVKEVIKKVEKLQESLRLWQEKLKNLNIAQNNLKKGLEEKEADTLPEDN